MAIKVMQPAAYVHVGATAMLGVTMECGLQNTCICFAAYGLSAKCFMMSGGQLLDCQMQSCMKHVLGSTKHIFDELRYCHSTVTNVVRRVQHAHAFAHDARAATT